MSIINSQSAKLFWMMAGEIALAMLSVSLYLYQVNGIGAKMSDVANSTNQIQFCLFASGGKISAPATRSLFTFPMNSTLNFPPLTGTHDATRKANLP